MKSVHLDLFWVMRFNVRRREGARIYGRRYAGQVSLEGLCGNLNMQMRVLYGKVFAWRNYRRIKLPRAEKFLANKVNLTSF